jgi:hypothetical protein
MSKCATIYVRLMDEGLEVWRPVAARRVSADTYLILDQGYDPGVETWEFEPGAVVRGRRIQREGREIVVAAEFVGHRSTAPTP